MPSRNSLSMLPCSLRTWVSPPRMRVSKQAAMKKVAALKAKSGSSPTLSYTKEATGTMMTAKG